MNEAAAFALERLLEGNRRFRTGSPSEAVRSPERRLHLASGQRPRAGVLACSDSRVPPEILFDQGLGDIFVVRNAGNIASVEAIGSLEYAVAHLGIPLIIVLGHSGCGAVQSALCDDPISPFLRSLVAAIRPSVEATASMAGDLCDHAAQYHAGRTATILSACSPALRHPCDDGRLTILAAYYRQESGDVTILS